MRTNYTQRHAEMLQLYGVKKGHICGDCDFLRCHARVKGNIYKCTQYAVTMSAATDWRKKWAACRLWWNLETLEAEA